MTLAEMSAVLGVAASIGLLVGLQRERQPEHVAGLRTFGLTAILGASCGLVFPIAGGWMLIAGMLGVIVLITLAALRHNARVDSSLTTEVALVVIYVVGVMIALLPMSIGVAVGVAVAILLQSKRPLQAVAAKIGERDMAAILQFAAITFIVLPVVPDTTVGPLGVVNPHHLWLMVVLVVGMSLGGYLAYKFIGARHGVLLGGLLGGLISSTATTVAYARRAAGTPRGASVAAFVIVLAGAVVYVRLLVEIAVAGPSLLPHAWVPVGLMAAVSLLTAALLWTSARKDADGLPEQTNPTELKSALLFALIFAGVLLASAYARTHFGDTGVYSVAAISGLTDMDAITLSMSRLAERGDLDHETAWRAILVASISNIVFKAGLVAALGGRRLIGPIALVSLLKVSAAAALIALW